MSFNFRVLRGTLLVLAFVFASCLSVARSEPFDNASDVISRTDPVSEQVDATAHTPKVFSHFIVGNTYNYTVSTWANDIAIAHSKGIDAFALNVGADYWEPSQVANAYSAAAQLNTTFKLFISFDMTSLPCTSASDINILQYYINTYASHPNQQLYRGRVFTSAFAGESCTFGAATLNDGWINAVKTNVAATYFVPAFFVNPAIFPNLTVMDGGFNWNSGWPMGDYDIDFGPDESYISALDGRSYMAAASPWFFTHYGPDSYNKNFIYRSDDWLWAERWELLVQNRTSVPFTEVVSWNDYGESHYIGPVEGIQPNSQAWVDGFDHQGWLDLMHYYIKAYKNGSYPTIHRDRVFLWARLYPANATAPDPVGRPANWEWTQDYLWAVALLTKPANVTLACGTTSQTTYADAGLTKLKLPLTSTCTVTSTVVRNGYTVVNFAPAGFQFSTNLPSYNFNAFVAASPA